VHGDRTLAFKGKPTRVKLQAESLLIDLFEKPGPRAR